MGGSRCFGSIETLKEEREIARLGYGIHSLDRNMTLDAVCYLERLESSYKYMESP